MRKAYIGVLTVILAVGITFGAEEQDGRTARKGSPLSVAELASTSSGWLQLPQLDLAAYDYYHAEYHATGVVWIMGWKPSSPRDPIAWKSADNGGSWTKVTITSADRGVFAALDADTALYGTTAGNMLRTTDGGTTWTTVYSYGSGVGWFDGVKFLNATDAIAFGDADGSGLCVVRSTDAGATWTRSTNLPAEEATPDKWFALFTYNQALEVYGNTVWIALYAGSGNFPRILKSTDAGATWDSWEVQLAGGSSNNYYFKSINFMDDSLGFVVDRRTSAAEWYWMHKSTDGGVTWSDTIRIEPGVIKDDQELTGIKPIRGTDIVVALGNDYTAGSGKSWWSTDRGNTWSIVPVPGKDLWNGAFKSATEGFAVGDNNIVKYTGKDVVNVTFMLNAATVPDTLPLSGQTVQIRGGVNHAGGFSPITWGNDAQNNMTSVGGDYWKKTFAMQVGDTLRYKYVINTASGTGWEQSVVPAVPGIGGGDRAFVVPAQDTVLDFEFWNNGPDTNPQFFRPWTPDPDTMYVHFRVSMLGPITLGTFGPFNNDTDTVGVRGGGPAGGDLNWAPTYYLTREAAPSNSGSAFTVDPTSFWSGTLKFPKDAVTEGETIQYKFLIGYDWGRDEFQGGQPNRTFTVPVGKKDTTLQWGFFNNERPIGRANTDTVRVEFRTNLAKAISNGGFSIGDTIQVQSGFFGTTTESGRTKNMIRVAGTLYTIVDTIITSKGELLDYQYYVMRNGTAVRENYYNFTFSGPIQGEAERRQIEVPLDASLTNTMIVLDTATSITQARRQPEFPNSRALARNVNVTYKVDLRPAFYQVLQGDVLEDIQGDLDVGPTDIDSILAWGLWMNGLAVGDWSNPTGGDWGLGLRENLNKKLWDDGTNGDDVAGDTVFSRIVQVGPDSTRGTLGRVGQVFKFGIYGGDNEGGQGGFGNNHLANVVDADSIYTLEAQFGSINPAFYDAWDFDNKRPATPTGVIDPTKPLTYELAQNYPNPFNPATKIRYSIPVQSNVVLKVYNAIGQEVATLTEGVQTAGLHTVEFDARNLASGLYFYRITAGNFVSVKKMMLLK